jgi:hypothetical protein
MTDRPTLLDPNDIIVGNPGDPLASGHIPAHQQIKDELIINANALAAGQATIAALPRGRLASIIGPPTLVQLPAATLTTYLTLTGVPIVAGNWYRVYGHAFLGNAGAPTGPIYCVCSDNLDTFNFRPFHWGGPMPTAAGTIGGSSWAFLAATSQTINITLAGFTQAGTIDAPANTSAISIDHIGIIPP